MGVPRATELVPNDLNARRICSQARLRCLASIVRWGSGIASSYFAGRNGGAELGIGHGTLGLSMQDL